MSAFDSNINVVGTSIGVPTEEQLENGHPSALEIALKVGQVLPFSQGPGAPPVIAEFGTLRFALDRDTAIEFFEKGLEEAKKLPAKAKIDIAQSMAGVDVAAEKLAKLSGRK